MALTQASYVVGNHGFFFRDGDAYTVPSSGTASRTAKPGATDPQWVNFGPLELLEVEQTQEEREIYAPTPGKIVLYDVIETKRIVAVEFVAVELSPVALELLYGTLKLTGSSTQYNPLEGVTKKGWLKIQQYSQADVLLNTVDLFVHLKVNGKVAFGDDTAKVSFSARSLHSTLNTGTL